MKPVNPLTKYVLAAALLGSSLLLAACESHKHEEGAQHAHEENEAEGHAQETDNAHIAPATAAAAGVQTEVAGPATIADTLNLTGRLVPNAEHVRAVSARFPGSIKEVAASVADVVKAGQRLASVESNDSLQTYPVTAPIGGTIIDRHANPGEVAGAEPLFVIADYRQLWAELSLFPRDLARVKAGQEVLLKAIDGDTKGKGKIIRVAPSEGSQHGARTGVYTARVEVDNSDGRWTPGLFIEGQIRLSESPIPLAVKRSALQSLREHPTVVFEQIGETYEARVVTLGRQDDIWAEVIDGHGLKPGAIYVTVNSYLIKADIEKSGASHEH